MQSDQAALRDAGKESRTRESKQHSPTKKWIRKEVDGLVEESPSVEPMNVKPDKDYCKMNSVLEEPDEYGAELGRDSQFWKTYVKEADRWDTELVEGWNKSTDVILIFAALFSAVCTAFVVESSKGLQEDPAQISAQTLILISHTLLEISKNNRTSLELPPVQAVSAFAPSASSVWVNFLWYLSLSISVAVSLIAMLAKEWCYSFMSGRTGHPCLQARRRQQGWDGIVRWKMPELLAFLPSLIHLALLLFAVGLCIRLWDVHGGVATPVIFVTLASLGIYATSTVIPLFYDFCPYSTTVTKIFKSLIHTKSQPSDDNPKQDMITSQALHWMIINCEVPRSVDIALQAIAGANEDLPRSLLKECGADTLICRRLTSSNSYSANYGAVVSLYARALSFLRSQHFSSQHKPDDDGSLEVKLWGMHFTNERRVANGLGDGNFIPTNANLAALRIGSTATSYCLRMMNNHQLEDLALVDTAAKLFGQHLGQEIVLHPAALLSLLNATKMLFICGMVRYDDKTTKSFLMMLVQAHAEAQELELHMSMSTEVAMILATAALSRHDYPGWTRPPPFSNSCRVQRALEMIDHYDPSAQLDPHTQSSLMHFGLSSLLWNTTSNCLGEADYLILAKAFNRILLYPEGAIHTLPAHYDLITSIARDHLKHSWPAPGQVGSLNQETKATTYIYALKTSTGDFTGHHIPTDEAYIFVIETACRAQSDELRHACLRLLARFPFPVLSEGLVDAMVRQGILQLLLRRRNSENQDLALFSQSQLWVLLDLSLGLDDYPQLEHFLAPLLGFVDSSDRIKRINSLLRVLENSLSQIWVRNDTDASCYRYGSAYISRVRERITEKQKHFLEGGFPNEALVPCVLHQF